MLDPLANFPWAQLHTKYQSACKASFDKWASGCLDSYQPKPSFDRALYHSLVESFAQWSTRGVSLSAYKAMLCWKLYSTKRGKIAGFCNIIDQEPVRESTETELARILKNLPAVLPNDIDEIVRVLTGLTKSLHGMRNSCAIPVRTTFLHFIYPRVMPIFDKMVLQAVGVSEKDANHSYEFLREYVPHAWSLAEKYKINFAQFDKETPIRLIDVALWLIGKKVR